MIMTRKKDVFWALYAAIFPWLVIVGIGKLEGMIQQYIRRTYDSSTAIWGAFALALIYGILLAVLGIRYLSKNAETSKAPLIGLCIGLIYSVVLFSYWPLAALGIGADFLYRFAKEAYGSTRIVTVMGFYIVLLIYYVKTNAITKKKEPMKSIESETDQKAL